MICGMTIYQIFWYFIIYSLIGWMIEVVFHAVTQGKIVNRGFLNGPICPVYGSGVLMVLIVLFLIGSILGIKTSVETSHPMILFAIGRLIFRTGDATYLVLLEIYGADGLLTISHRIMLHENLGQAHRKHAYQIMANELKIGHVKISLLYMFMQLAVSLGFIYLCPNTILAHWCYLVGISVILIVAYILFMIKYYPLHEAYLKSLKNGNSVNK